MSRVQGVLAALAVAAAANAATTVVTYPDPQAYFVDNKFRVEVRAADAPDDSSWLHAPTYTSHAPDDGPHAMKGKTASFVQVSTDGPLKVRCRWLADEWDDDAVVRPSALGISTDFRPDYNTLELSVPAPTAPGAYSFSVEDPETLQDALLVFINPLETDIPTNGTNTSSTNCSRDAGDHSANRRSSGACGVRVFTPGDHRADASMQMLGGGGGGGGGDNVTTVVFSAGVHYIAQQTFVANHTRVYLAGGAVVFGSFTSNTSAANITVDGRGIISGHLIASVGHASDALTLVNLCGSGMTIRGIVAVDAPSYLCVLARTRECECVRTSPVPSHRRLLYGRLPVAVLLHLSVRACVVREALSV